MSAEPERSPPGPIRRLAALIYDLLLLAGVLFAAIALLLWLRGGTGLAPQEPAFRAYLLGVSFFFVGWFWVHGGQTPGMRAWKIRLVDANGGRLGWTRAALRFCAALFSLSLFGLGFLWAFFRRDKRCWHDLLARTTVVWAG
jgi:uncharacterized RDD family membrane protein YckC